MLLIQSPRRLWPSYTRLSHSVHSQFENSSIFSLTPTVSQFYFVSLGFLLHIQSVLSCNSIIYRFMIYWGLIRSILYTSPFVSGTPSVHSFSLIQPAYSKSYLCSHSVQCLAVEDNKADLYSVEEKVVMPFRQTDVLMPRNQVRPDHATMANVRQSGWHQNGVR